MFEYEGMVTAPASRRMEGRRGTSDVQRSGDSSGPQHDAVGEARAALERITALRARMADMEDTRVDTGALPTMAAVQPLLPGGAIRSGAVYSVQDSLLLVSAMMQAVSAAGSWCAVVGEPSFGIESAHAVGIDLERLVLVPDPGERWLAVVSALADVATIVVARPQGRITPGDANRIAARLRQRGAALIALGAWPGSEVTLRVTERNWDGIGHGFGFIGACRATVTASGRAGSMRPIRHELMLPAADGSIQQAAPARQHDRPHHDTPSVVSIAVAS
ncbi:hypothetical protein [Curtobacterium ammoniigenes]|uniref:hypothetical protein n=1 Tax=Curtobacterium ammoniigenes TaxID=395387 RepID=UPI0012EEB62A|nr:hypothetical protein [Curtobacterium ammoniigenes]